MESLKNWLDNTNVDFVGRRKPAAALSALAVIASWLVIIFMGPNWGIDFTGGTEIHLAFEDPVDISEMRDALRSLDLSEDAVQQVGGPTDYEFTIRIQDPTFGMEGLVEEVRNDLTSRFGADWIQEFDVSAEVGARMEITYAGDPITPGQAQEALTGIEGISVQPGSDINQLVVTVPGLSQLIEAEIASAMGDRSFDILSIDAVGPKVGSDLRTGGILAVGAMLVLILIYVAFRFELSFAPGAVLALFHDVSVVAGIFTLMRVEFSVSMIGALLTIVGYSLNDTIIIYDRIRENLDRYRRSDFAELINISINETFSRTLTTGVTTSLAITPFLLFGSTVISDFALAIILGIIFGIYSTIFVATPMVVIMQDVQPWLSKYVALGGGSSGPPGDDGDDDVDPSTLSESEKRRRERADAERRGSVT